jgi:excisionase family DNA binding protein
VPDPPDQFMTVAEVASILKLNQQTVRNWIDQGSLPALHVRSAGPHPARRLRPAARGKRHRRAAARRAEHLDGEVPAPVVPTG